jgi:hypothetical protein
MVHVRAAFVVAVAVGALVLVTDCSSGTRYLACSARNTSFGPGSTTDGEGCRTCLEDNCCAELGRCQPQELQIGTQERVDDPAPCLSRASRLFECAVDAGNVSDPTCRTRLGVAPDGDEVSLLSCAGRRCPSCGVPAPCQLDPSVPAIVNGTCDACVSAKCCHKVQACYADRRCKLAFECMVNTKNKDGCVDQLTASAAKLEKGSLGRLARFACATDASPTPLTEDVPECLRSCVSAFDPNQCLALDLLACLDDSGCLAACGSSSDAGAPDTGAAEAGPADASGD